jgi:hypothetical protein
MAMGRLSNRRGVVQPISQMVVALAPRYAFCDRCNDILASAEFDETIEMLCQPYDTDTVSCTSIAVRRYFRMLFVDQSKGLDSKRETAWRCADALSLHRLLHLQEGETVPDHSTLTITHSRLPLEVYHAVFRLHPRDRRSARSGARQADRHGSFNSGSERHPAASGPSCTGEDHREMLRRLAQDSGWSFAG